MHRPIKKTNCAMRNLGIAIDIGAAEPRNRRSTCENYLRIHEHAIVKYRFLLRPSFIRRFCHSFIPFSLSLFLHLSLFFFCSSSNFTATNHSIGHPISMLDTRIAHSLSVSFHPRSENEQEFVGDVVGTSVNIIHGRPTLKLKITWLYVSISMRRERIYERI